ncbi:hypothetical protein J2T08_002953 [Neorhizobium galegae]|uniref:hypothetical protein n=1 Tax=Neorhizobium galegae TaxID=399 RepID=UPI0027828E4F|nr:hypothetical protein [Neorhizobium galegae]MDQ0135032.1 hypothetical protein [Neorhizobium galegae]
MRQDINQLDLFAWAEGRPSAVILDARPQIERRIMAYMVSMAMTGNFPDREARAQVLTFGRDRGAA